MEHVNTLIAQASPFLRFPEEFLCWVGISRNYLLKKDTYPRFEYENGEEMDLNAFIRTADPRKVRIVERPRTENERPIAVVPITDDIVAEADVSRPKRSKKKRVIRGSEGTPAASHPPKRLRADYGRISGSTAGGKSPGVLNKLLQDSRLSVEQGVTALPTLPFITSIMLLLHFSGATNSAGPEGDSFVRSIVPVTTEATTVTTIATTVAIPADVGKDKSVSHPSVFGASSSSEKTDRTLSLFTGRSGSGFAAGSIRAEEVTDAGLEEIYVPEWTVTKGFEFNDGRSCANMIDHFTPPAFFKTVRGMEHEQLFVEFNVSAARNLSLSSEVRMRAEYNILEKRKWRSLAEEKDSLLGAKDKEIEELRSQLLKAKEESVVVHELETSFARLREQLDLYEGNMKQLEEFQDNLMRPLETRLAEFDVDFTRCCMRFQESFHPHLLNAIAGRRWLLTHGIKLLMAKCLNSIEYMEALGNGFSRAIEKGMQEGLAAGIKHGQAGRCLTDLEAYIPSVEVDFNSAVCDLCSLNFPLLQELLNKKDASTWDVMDLLRLDDAVAEALGMTDLQPDVNQLMVPVHHKQDRVVIGSQALSVALDICRGRVEKMERNLAERLPFLKDVFVSLDHPLSAEALIEPPIVVPATNALSTMVIVPHSGPSVSVEDYENPDLADVVPKNVTPGPEGEENIDASTGGDLAFSKLENEDRDVVL
ncbi:hypothetical protein Tco_1113056 [Tanacetum coccineum]|uniref:Transposase (Putative), gypsy type n=1 Tax=Tanacetum coccineum TaxID=301880 RepID=A0ABQ5IU39_9ASTR